MEDACIVEKGAQMRRLLVLQKGAGKTKNNRKSTNMTSETKTKKNLELIKDVPSGSGTALCPLLR